jgi:RNA polymerase sigma-70 factor (ECF subfamily)
MSMVNDINSNNIDNREKKMECRHLKLVDTPAESTDKQISDDDLMRLTKSGQKSAFEALYRRHRDLVFGFAVRYLNNHALGRDVTQDVFLSLWAERDRYQPRGRFRSYLFSIMLHRCQYVARQHASDLAKTAQAAQATISDEVAEQSLQELLEKERNRAVREKLADLPPKLREVMILRYVNGLSLQEIAEVKAMPLGTIKVRVFRGLKRLHGMFEERS